MRNATSIRLLSWNLLHGSGAQADDVARLVDLYAPDLVLMQEAGSSLDALPARIGGHYERRQMGHRKHGPAVWSRHPFEEVATIALPRATKVDLPIPIFRSLAERVALVVRVNTLCIANVHLDHGQLANRRQLRHLVATGAGIDVIAGDFNALGSTRLARFADVGPRRPTHFAKGLVPVRIDRCLARNLVATRAEALERGKSDELASAGDGRGARRCRAHHGHQTPVRRRSSARVMSSLRASSESTGSLNRRAGTSAMNFSVTGSRR